MSERGAWQPYEGGGSIGQKGSENGTIIADEQFPGGARITMERDGSTPFAVTCGIHGWMLHTQFATSLGQAQELYDKSKVELENIVKIIPSQEDRQKVAAVVEAIASFLQRFP